MFSNHVSGNRLSWVAKLKVLFKALFLSFGSSFLMVYVSRMETAMDFWLLPVEELMALPDDEPMPCHQELLK